MALIAIAMTFQSREAAQGQTFLSNLEGYASGTLVNSTSEWIATTGAKPPTVETLVSQVARIPIDNFQLTSAFMQPKNGSGQLHWSYGRSCEQFLRVEFDILPVLQASGGVIDGKMGVYFTPISTTGDLTQSTLSGDVGAAVEIPWKSGSSTTVNVLARSTLNTIITVAAFDVGILGSLLGNTTKLRIDFA
jgi:hypothetical protein